MRILSWQFMSTLESCKLYRGVVRDRLDKAQMKLETLIHNQDCITVCLETLLVKNEIWLLQNMLKDVNVRVQFLELIDSQASKNPIKIRPPRYWERRKYTTWVRK